MSLFFPKDEAPGQLLPDPGPQGPPGPTGPQGPAGAAGASTWDELTGKPTSFAPSAHKASHATGGSDALSPVDIGAQPAGLYATLTGGKVPADQLTIFAYNTPGIVPSSSGGEAGKYLKGDGTWDLPQTALFIAQSPSPITTGSIGTIGQITFDSTHIYICTATNTWRRTAITSW